MYRFSIVIPMLGSASSFELTLASILRYRPESCQVIVAHDGSYDDPHGLSEEIELVATNQDRHLVRLFNCGLQVAKGELIGLIRPGIELGEGWEESVADAFEDDKVGSVTPGIVSREQSARLVCAGVATSFKHSRQLTGTGKGLQFDAAVETQTFGSDHVGSILSRLPAEFTGKLRRRT